MWQNGVGDFIDQHEDEDWKLIRNSMATEMIMSRKTAGSEHIRVLPHGFLNAQDHFANHYDRTAPFATAKKTSKKPSKKEIPKQIQKPIHPGTFCSKYKNQLYFFMDGLDFQWWECRIDSCTEEHDYHEECAEFDPETDGTMEDDEPIRNFDLLLQLFSIPR